MSYMICLSVMSMRGGGGAATILHCQAKAPALRTHELDSIVGTCPSCLTGKTGANG